MEFNAEYTGKKYKEIAKAMGVKDVDTMNQAEYRKAVIDDVKKFSADIGIPMILKEIGVKEADLDALTDAAMTNVALTPLASASRLGFKIKRYCNFIKTI